MAKVFRAWDVDQGWLLPPSLHEFVPPGHMAHFVRDTVREALDLSAILGTYSEERGYPPYHPGMMVALLLYGYSRGLSSSRQLARACEERVDVIYRRVDDDFLDPVHFRRDSMLGVTGLISAVRAGRVTLANAIGNGVADDKLVYSYVPDLIRYYLGEEPILHGVDTYRCNEPEALQEVLSRLDEMVVKPVDGSGGKGLVIGPKASGEELDELRANLERDPRGWIAQPVVQLSTVPTLIDGQLRPRHVDLRPFAVNDGDQVTVLPGGLTRVALPEGQLVVNSSQGGGSKDTWVLAGRYAKVPTSGDEVILLGTNRPMPSDDSAPPTELLDSETEPGDTSPPQAVPDHDSTAGEEA